MSVSTFTAPSKSTQTTGATTQTLNTTTSANLVSSLAVSTQGATITCPPFFAAISATVSATAGTSAISDVWFYFLDSSGQSVGQVELKPENFGTASATVTFTTPAQIAQVQVYSWWNPATAVNLQVTTINAAVSENLVANQLMTPSLQVLPLPSAPYFYVNQATYAMTAATTAISNAWYYFTDVAGERVGQANANPVDLKAAGGSTLLLPPADIGSVSYLSWWNGATATELQLNYIPTATTPDYASGQTVDASGTTIPVACDYVVAATVSATAGTSAISDVWFNFLDPTGAKVGAVQVQPVNNGTSQITFVFPTPIQVASVQMVSWWNPASIVALELSYLVGAP